MHDQDASHTTPPPPPGAASAPSAPNRDGQASNRDRRIVAIALIAVGALALLGTLGLAPALSTFVGVALFASIGVACVAIARRSGNDWVLAAAFPAFGLALAVLLADPWGGAAFLLGLGAGFLSLYLAARERWWALIPTGVLFTLGVVASLDRPGGTDSGVVFFLGLALTFLVLWRLPDHPQGWAVYPAAALGFMTVLVASAVSSWLLSALLIGAGVVLLLRSRERSSAA